MDSPTRAHRDDSTRSPKAQPDPSLPLLEGDRPIIEVWPTLATSLLDELSFATCRYVGGTDVEMSIVANTTGRETEGDATFVLPAAGAAVPIRNAGRNLGFLVLTPQHGHVALTRRHVRRSVVLALAATVHERGHRWRSASTELSTVAATTAQSRATMRDVADAAADRRVLRAVRRLRGVVRPDHRAGPTPDSGATPDVGAIDVADRSQSTRGGDGVMIAAAADNWIGLGLAVLLTIYLVVVLVRPEKF